ncbi:rhodanese-like domain-containing protein [Schaalia vaccimaxillae]|uniref:rhodanese-like domain-containing protein n=1 Tax=Schaalia vaccimaxillae TaxID=183916 RepID=UPI0003B6CA60|nr:rhodanese-like domain-containing protein [Schaalia vaccimaxillae]
MTKKTIIDVRTPEEFAEGHLDGAINIDIKGENFAEEIAKLDRDGSYAVHCKMGMRAQNAVDQMTELGFVDATNLLTLADASETLGVPVVND